MYFEVVNDLRRSTMAEIITEHSESIFSQAIMSSLDDDVATRTVNVYDTKGQTMTVLQAARTKASSGATGSGRLFFLELSGDRIHSMNVDGSDRKTIVTIAICPTASWRMRRLVIFIGPTWASPTSTTLNRARRPRRRESQGSLSRRALRTRRADPSREGRGKLYWSDREGMRVMRSNLDGSQVETLVETGRGEKDRRDQTGGAWESPSIRSLEQSTGRKKADERRTRPSLPRKN